MKVASIPMEADSELMEEATTCASKESASVPTKMTKSEHSVVSFLSVLLRST